MEDRFRERDGEFASKWVANLHVSGRNGLQIAGEISGDRHGPKATGRPKVLRPKMVEIMTCLLIGKHFWIALVLATLLLKIVIAPLRIRRSAPHRSAPTSAASLRTVRQDTDVHRLRSQDIHLTPSH